MRKVFTLVLLFSVLMCSGVSAAVGPLIGIYSIPNLDYPTLASILAAANTYGIDPAAGTVTINVNKDETAPTGGFVLGSATLNGTLSISKLLVINGKGHVLTDTTGVGNNDAIFTIQGADYVTISNFTLKENAANTTNAAKAERGFSVVKLNSNDGVKYLSIKNCSIFLDKTNTTAATGIAPAGATGIFIGNCTASSATSLSAPSAPDGAHESIYMSEDTIQNVRQGVYGQGLNVPIDGIVYNDMGVTVDKAFIQNFIVYGVYLQNFNNDYVQNSYINNISGGGTAPTGNAVFGAFYNGPASSTNNSWNCQKNTIDLTIAGTGNAAFGIYTQLQGTGTTVISEDSVKLTSTGASAQLIGIMSQNNLGTQTISNNVIHDFSTATTNAQIVAGIYNGYSSAIIYPTTSTISGNLITAFTATGGSANPVIGCADNNFTTASSNFNNNTISNFTVNALSNGMIGYGSLYNYNTTLVNSSNINGNTITGISASGNATTILGIRMNSAYLGHTQIIDKNKINSLTGGTGDAIAIRTDFGAATTISRDTIDKISGSGNALGILSNNTGFAAAILKINDNQITNLSSSTTSTFIAGGMVITPGTGSYTMTSASIYNNTLAGYGNSGTAGRSYGIYSLSGSATHNIYNNMISDMAAVNNTADYSSVFGIYLGTTGANNIYYNTVNLNVATSAGSGYGATGLQFTPAGTNTIKNNILRANITAGTGNNVAAIRGATGSAKSAASLSGFGANSNIYYTPASANNYLYVDGTTNASLVNGYAVSGLTANTTKNIVNDTFFNSDCGRSSYHAFMGTASRESGSFTENNLGASGLWFAPSGYTYAESGGVPVAATGSDIAAISRSSSTPDIGALEFSGTLMPIMNIAIASSTGFDTACPTNLPTLLATIPAYFTHVSYQWYKDTTLLAGDTSLELFIDATGGHYVLHVYDSVTGCTRHSDSFLVTIVPPPPAMITYYDSLVFCETSAVVISANAGPNYTYQWYKDGISIPGANSISNVVNTAGNYQVQINTPLGCPSMSAPIGARVYPLPTPTIMQIGRYQLKTQLYYSYQWYRNGKIIPDDPAHTSIGQSYYATDDGAYTVVVVDSNGCTNKSSILLFTLGINDPSISDAIKVYPNPTTGIVNISSPVPVQVSLTDMTGRVIMPAATVKSIDLGEYASGLYLMTITDSDGKEIRKEKITKSSQ